MKPTPPYNWGPEYKYRSAWTGWDGVYRWIDNDGSIHLKPILDINGAAPRKKKDNGNQK